jgi:Flp pilus assembly protein TadG
VTAIRRRRAKTRHATGQRGQSLVELAIAMPVVLILLLGMLEFGFAFSHHLTLEYATREGARMGAALANGTDEVACTGELDGYIIAAVQRVLTGTNGQIPIAQVKEIRIYEADATGADTGISNKWIPGAGPSVEGAPLLFNRSGTQFWDPCTRNNTTGNTDSIGVSLAYDYIPITPLSNLMRLSGSPVLRISDRTVMALNPGAN